MAHKKKSKDKGSRKAAKDEEDDKKRRQSQKERVIAAFFKTYGGECKTASSSTPKRVQVDTSRNIIYEFSVKGNLGSSTFVRRLGDSAKTFPKSILRNKLVTTV